ncbi:MAG: 5-enolpyruvylshikimate-3-phosphate synthase, partial [Desulfovibrio sp.]|nr:5-enolpyruvylshikimate-3-phosphate synthase [Desulfovibrio sp.]
MAEYTNKPGERTGRRPEGVAETIIELDRELMKLLARRGVLLSRLREGKEQATGAAAIRAEKAVRIAWEAEAVNFSKDPLFSRQLFNLLQEIRVLRKEEAQNAPVFNLNPPRRPVSGRLDGPTDVLQARMRLILAACLGQELELKNVLLTSEMLDAVKICSRAGADCAHDGRGTGSVAVRAGKPLELGGKTFFVGDDFFVFCLIMFMALAKPGTLRFNGGSRLKFSDLSVLRGFLPQLGARFYHIVPRSHGLPAGLECSGEIPDMVRPPAEMPVEAVCALLAAPVFWQRPFQADLALLSEKTLDMAL